MHRLKTKFVSALRNLTLHKFRVLLNLLGVVFGVSSVIAMLAITEGARLNTERQFAALGATEIIIQSVRPADDLGLSEQESNDNDTSTSPFGVTDADLGRIISTIPAVVNASSLRAQHERD